MRTQLITIVLIVLCAILATRSDFAWAQKGAAHCQERPWDRGVSEDDIRRAKELYHDGNKFYDHSMFAEAASKYLAATALWDHPRLHYNLMLAYMNMGNKEVEAYKSLLVVLACGGDFVSAENFRKAESFRQLLEPQVAEVEVVSAQPGVEVIICGRVVLPGKEPELGQSHPGRARLYMRAKKCDAEARHKKLVDAKRSIALKPATLNRLDVELVTSKTITGRRMKRWIPAAVAVGSVGLVALSLRAGREARSSAATFREEFDSGCEDGCLQSEFKDDLSRLSDRAFAKKNIFLGTAFVASAAVAAGLTLLILNRERQYPNPEVARAIRVKLQPQVNVGLGSVSLSGEF